MRLVLDLENKSEEIRRHRPDSSTQLRDDRASLRALQRDAGNQAVQSLFRSGFVKAALSVSHVDDPAEREADAIAAQITCGETPDRAHDDAFGVRRSPAAVPSPVHAPGTIEQVLHSAGQPLDPAIRAFFEPRFGHDFSHIRIHSGPEAAASARSINALAYTAGSDIVFTHGGYQPGTPAGRRLLAHELAHTIQQQRDGRGPRVQRSLLPGGVGDWHEMAQALTIIIAGVDLAAIATQIWTIARDEAAAYVIAGSDYGPQNALRHCIFAALLDTWGWRAAIAELLGGIFLPFPFVAQLKPLLAVYGATMALRVRAVLWAHEKFADDGCGNYGTGTVDSECDQHNNEVGISIGGPFMSNADVILAAKAALDGGTLWMTPGPKSLSTIVSTAGWRTSLWMDRGPQQPDCSYVTKK